MEFLNAFGRRFREPSTYAGLPLAVVGLGMLFDWDEAQPVAEVIGQVGPAVAAGDWVTGAVVGLSGLAAIFMKENR